MLVAISAFLSASSRRCTQAAMAAGNRPLVRGRDRNGVRVSGVSAGAKRAAVIDTVVRTVHRVSDELHTTHFMLFGLRDADSSKPDLFHQFGIMRDDYTRKPAY